MATHAKQELKRRGWWERATREYPALMYLDALMLSEIILAGAALYISSHGVYTFFGYLMPDQYMTLAATIVLSFGIPVMESAWVAIRAKIRELQAQAARAATPEEAERLRAEAKESTGDKRFFFSFMVALLLIEALAQYFQGQAIFATRVIAYFRAHAEYVGIEKSSIDLLTLAQDGIAGRLLATIYLGSITGAVFFIIRAAVDRATRIAKAVAERYDKYDHEAALQLEVAQLGDKLAAAEEDKRGALDTLRAQLEAQATQAVAAVQGLLEAAQAEVQRLTGLLEGADGRLQAQVTAAEGRVGSELQRLGAEVTRLTGLLQAEQAARVEAERAKERQELQAQTYVDRLQAQHETALATARAEAAQEALSRVRQERISDMTPVAVATNGSNGNGSRGRLRAQVIEIVNEAWARGEEGVTREQIAGLLEIHNPDADTLKYIGEIASRRKGELRKGAAQPEEG